MRNEPMNHGRRALDELLSITKGSREYDVAAVSEERTLHSTARRQARCTPYVRCGQAFASLADASFRRRTRKASTPLMIPVSSKHAKVTRSHQPRSG